MTASHRLSRPIRQEKDSSLMLLAPPLQAQAPRKAVIAKQVLCGLGTRLLLQNSLKIWRQNPRTVSLTVWFCPKRAYRFLKPLSLTQVSLVGLPVMASEQARE
jgi:hypothetical protein